MISWTQKLRSGLRRVPCYHIVAPEVQQIVKLSLVSVGRDSWDPSWQDYGDQKIIADVLVSNAEICPSAEFLTLSYEIHGSPRDK